jgi:hypothetical protein
MNGKRLKRPHTKHKAGPWFEETAFGAPAGMTSRTARSRSSIAEHARKVGTYACSALGTA